MSDRQRTVEAMRGFTLMEILVALAITAMVVSVLMSSVFYGVKVQSAVRHELTQREPALRARFWFTEVLSSCLPAESSSPARFVGVAKEVACDSTHPLQGQAQQSVQRVRFGLREREGAPTELLYTPATADAAPVALTALPEGAAEFVYFDHQGQEVPKWPISGQELQSLPQRIALRVKPDAGEKFVLEWPVSLRATPWLEPGTKLPPGFGLIR